MPSLALGVVGGFAGGVLDTAVPPALDAVGSAASLAGVLFTGYSVTSLLGGLVYGLRRWPGRIHRQAAIWLAMLCAVLLPAALVPSLPVIAVIAVIAVIVVAAGLFAAPEITARALTLQRDLPESAWSAVFSALYAATARVTDWPGSWSRPCFPSARTSPSPFPCFSACSPHSSRPCRPERVGSYPSGRSHIRTARRRTVYSASLGTDSFQVREATRRPPS